MKPHVLVLNRWPQAQIGPAWDHELCRYREILPSTCTVSYLCDDEGAIGLDAEAIDGRLQRVADFDDLDAVRRAAQALATRHGPFTQVLAFSEYLLDAAAQLRRDFAIAGHTPEEVSRFRDKTEMKAALDAAGLRVPRWFACGEAQQVRRHAEALGFPLILKPVRGASSKGVYKIGSAAELEPFLADHALPGHEIEEFIEGDVLHVDGIVLDNGEIAFACVSQYISNCLAFESGTPLGSFILGDSPLARNSKAFADLCLRALGLRRSAFHLELFHRDGELVFLEVGARVPGADVPYVIERAFGVNLFAQWVAVLLDERPVVPSIARRASGGWITVPRPRPLPRQVVSATSLLGQVAGLYREWIPSEGQLLADTRGGYTHLQGGRFLVEGDDDRQVARALEAISRQYVLTTRAA
ncbi:ATP-grasp domain-containing protein (plasmid) [Burkholderia sp. FERM BP-3421]|uniref:ATP-grasp domain-containing protein n=1 Tax=Burkholderia sp. FERM BP-3421 TaxID=1494466 RepID=UPI00235DCA33|nr:ATP-grasp domain-containing protein [Burkholderia sp. FERM BP-3421]WDD90662.1 ATP-grasp domain-containing protein [Burkholderia sp. FERM BP-3421]